MVTVVLAAACGENAAAPPLVTTTVANGAVPAPTTPGADVLAPAAITQVDCPPAIATDTIACGIAEVALDPTAGSDTTASISIATMAGYDVGFRTPVAVLQGGPGGASSDLAGFFPQQPFTQVFVDQRGTGFASADFDCPEFDGVILSLSNAMANAAANSPPTPSTPAPTGSPVISCSTPPPPGTMPSTSAR